MQGARSVGGLIRRAKQGSRSGLGDLLESFRPLLSQLAAARIRSGLRRRFSASDIVQQTMLSASGGFDQFRGTTEAEFRSWLLHVFESRVADGIRRHRLSEKRRQSRERSGIVDFVADAGESPSQQLSRKEDARRLLDAITCLDRRDREIVLMRYCEQQSFEAIAQSLELPLTTVWRRWHNAVEQLRTRLND